MWAGPVGVCTPVGVVDVATPKGMRWSCPRPILVMASQPLWPFTGHEVLRGLFRGWQRAGTLSPELRTSNYSSARLGRDTWTSQGSEWFLVSFFDTSSQTLRCRKS